MRFRQSCPGLAQRWLLSRGPSVRERSACVCSPPYQARIVERLNVGAAELVVGDPTLEETRGALIRAEEIERINSGGDVDAQGGEITCGGRGLANQCYSPTVIVDAPGNTKVMNEEIFGPVLCERLSKA